MVVYTILRSSLSTRYIQSYKHEQARAPGFETCLSSASARSAEECFKASTSCPHACSTDCSLSLRINGVHLLCSSFLQCHILYLLCVIFIFVYVLLRLMSCTTFFFHNIVVCYTYGACFFCALHLPHNACTCQ